jgi:hypothetical protein
VSQQLDTYDSVTLDGAGNGQVTLAPDAFRIWTITHLNVRTSQGPTETPIPQCTVYRGAVSDGNILSQTWNGSRATATGAATIQPSEPLIVRWENGVPGSTATVSLYGTMEMR